MSNEPNELNRPEMNEIEAALAAWTPRAPQIDRDRLMFAAGMAAVGDAIAPTLILPLRGSAGVGADRPSSGRYLWPLATSLSTAATLYLAFLLAQQPPAPGTDQIANRSLDAVPDAQPEMTTSPRPEKSSFPSKIELPNVAEGTYFALRNQMLTTPADQWPRLMNDDIRGAAAFEDDAARKPSTRRNLLREFLPTEEPVRRNPTSSPAALTEQLQEALS